MKTHSSCFCASLLSPAIHFFHWRQLQPSRRPHRHQGGNDPGPGSHLQGLAARTSPALLVHRWPVPHHTPPPPLPLRPWMPKPSPASRRSTPWCAGKTLTGRAPATMPSPVVLRNFERGRRFARRQPRRVPLLPRPRGGLFRVLDNVMDRNSNTKVGRSDVAPPEFLHCVDHRRSRSWLEGGPFLWIGRWMPAPRSKNGIEEKVLTAIETGGGGGRHGRLFFRACPRVFKRDPGIFAN